MSREVLHHPDSWVTPCAATSILSGRPYAAWLGPATAETVQNVRLHPVDPSFDTALAGALQHNATKGLGGRVCSLREYQTGSESHSVLEGHLPSRVPLAYVVKVVMPQTVWDAFPDEAKRNAERTFPAGTIVKVADEAAVEREARKYSLADTTRERDLTGFCFTLPPTKRQQCVLPLVLNSNDIEATLIVEGGEWGLTVGRLDKTGTRVKGITVVVDRARSRAMMSDGEREVVAWQQFDTLAPPGARAYRLQFVRNTREVNLRLSAVMAESSAIELKLPRTAGQAVKWCFQDSATHFAVATDVHSASFQRLRVVEKQEKKAST